MQYYFADVELRGTYPAYALRYFQDGGISIEATDEELRSIRHELEYMRQEMEYLKKISAVRTSKK